MSTDTQNDLSAPVDVVVDASIVVKWFVPEIWSAETRRFLTSRYYRHVPVLCHSEVAQTLWEEGPPEDASAEEGRQIVAALKASAIEVHPIITLGNPRKIIRA